MALTKGFSLIETLVAITIATVATMALMRVISYASSTSAHAIKHFDSSLTTSLAIGSVTESLNGRTMSVYEILSERYNIDHPVIRETLQSASYEIRLLPKEAIHPLISSTVNVTGSQNPLNSFAMQKVILQNPHEKKSFYRLTSEHP